MRTSPELHAYNSAKTALGSGGGICVVAESGRRAGSEVMHSAGTGLVWRDGWEVPLAVCWRVVLTFQVALKLCLPGSRCLAYDAPW